MTFPRPAKKGKQAAVPLPTTYPMPLLLVQQWMFSDGRYLWVEIPSLTWQLRNKWQMAYGELPVVVKDSNDVEIIQLATAYIEPILKENYLTGDYRVLHVVGCVLLRSEPPRKPMPEITYPEPRLLSDTPPDPERDPDEEDEFDEG